MSISLSYLEAFIEKVNAESNRQYRLGSAYGSYELWDGGRRVEAGSKGDIYQYLIRHRFESSGPTQEGLESRGLSEARQVVDRLIDGPRTQQDFAKRIAQELKTELVFDKSVPDDEVAEQLMDAGVEIAHELGLSGMRAIRSARGAVELLGYHPTKHFYSPAVEAIEFVEDHGYADRIRRATKAIGSEVLRDFPGMRDLRTAVGTHFTKDGVVNSSRLIKAVRDAAERAETDPYIRRHATDSLLRWLRA